MHSGQWSFIRASRGGRGSAGKAALAKETISSGSGIDENGRRTPRYAAKRKPPRFVSFSAWFDSGLHHSEWLAPSHFR
jgi:hypothetical protein